MLRLRGLYLALITLMLAGGITVVLATVNFPNGGSVFLGYNGSLVHILSIRRPSLAASDPAYLAPNSGPCHPGQGNCT